MKVFVAILLVIGYVSARGSGPYLPSGWKPQGPAFYLPSEVAKPAATPVEEPQFSESEASGSDALREYGPPKLGEVILSVNQALPEVTTEQAFFVEIKNEGQVSAVDQAVDIEVNTQQAAAAVEEVATATESLAAEIIQVVQEEATELSDAEPTDSAQIVELQDVEVVTETVLEEIKEQEEFVEPTAVDVVPITTVVEEIIPTVSVVEAVVPLAQQELVQDAVVVPVSEVVVEEVTAGVNNIAEALVSLEKEVKAVEVQQAVENISEITSTTTQELSGSLEQGPEGFLEYGPPGFTEYGPPKQEDIARIAVQVANAGAVENNEVRRRRFSPKFRSTKKH